MDLKVSKSSDDSSSTSLYSPIIQGSNFVLELVQNADENAYPCDVEPTVTFILQETGVMFLSNDEGFSLESILALCDDVFKSKGKELSGDRYLDQKGIGFKSVFWVSDAPEIHSNEFNVKFNKSDGLPIVVPPCDVNMYRKLVDADSDPMDEARWSTCILLPTKNEYNTHMHLMYIFTNLYPHALLFLHRLKCIKYINLIRRVNLVMRKEVVGDGLINIYQDYGKMTWFVKSSKLPADQIRHDVQTTEISMAFLLDDLDNGNYMAKLKWQQAFAYILPLRMHGLKFIIQSDFIVLGDEVDVDSPWNQWLLSKFPNLFFSAERSFCSLHCFKENPAKGVSVFLSYAPLGGEVFGFFSCLPHMIISKLRVSNCLLLEGDDCEWVRPCKVVRNWTRKIRSLLPDSLIREHLDVGYLNKDVVLTESLARALDIEECGTGFLLRIMTSLCRAGSLSSMGLNWLSSWIDVLFLMSISGTDVKSSFSELPPFIPLLDGKYASINEGGIWFETNPEYGFEAFSELYARLRIVNPALFNNSYVDVDNLTEMLFRFGVQRLSAHEVIKVHILPAISDEKAMVDSVELMIEYLSFIMFHLESCCTQCVEEKEHIFSQLRKNAFIFTNHGYKRIADGPIHFGKDFGNPIDMSKLICGTDMTWFEVDTGYLIHPAFKSSPKVLLTWRKFLMKLGVTDFVKIVEVEKGVEWDSQELMHLLSHVSSKGNKTRGVYLLKILETLWDDSFSEKPYKSYVIRILHSSRWLASSMDDQLHFPKELFHNCDKVREVLGDRAPYTIPKVKNVKFLNDIGLKQIITPDDALSILSVWRGSKKPFRACVSQMSKFYTYLWSEMGVSKHKIVETLHSQAFIFVPHSSDSTSEVVSGLLLTPSEVYWQDPTCSMDPKMLTQAQLDEYMTHRVLSKMLSSVYPGLHNFFVNEFGVTENPPLLSYLQSLLQLSTERLPSQAAKTVVFQVFRKWSDGLDSGVLSSDDIDYLKKSLKEKEMTILPTVQEKWVSLHPSFGHIYWCDDEQLRKEFLNLNNIDLLCLGDLTNEEKQMLHDKVSVLFRRLGIPCLTEVVTREVTRCGTTDSTYMISLVRWALPYAQRYIYRMHPNEYSQFKQSGFKSLNSLKVVVVDKLFYKYVIKRFRIKSNNLSEGICLLQDNILYATPKVDSHLIFMELSRFLLSGIPEFYLANFLYMIKTMAESGFTEEKMELFITNNQKLSKLPCEELQWSLASTSSPEVESTTTKKFGKNLCWPPVHWKTTPGVDLNVAEGLFESNGDLIIDESSASSIPLVILEDDEALNDQSDSVHRQHVKTGRVEPDDVRYFSSPLSDKKIIWVNWITTPGFDNTKLDATSGLFDSNGDWIFDENLAEPMPSIYLEAYETSNDESDSDINKGKNKVSVPPKYVITGREGERAAFKHFCAELGDTKVKWVNEVKESGHPYDILVEGKDNNMEYIEVKSTSGAKKDWFYISMNEWKFAVKKGESFSIARVVLLDGKLPKITIYRNPAKLCQRKQLQLILSPPKW